VMTVRKSVFKGGLFMEEEIVKLKNSETKISFKNVILNSLHRDWQLWVMVLPAIIVIFIFNYMPMYGIQLAFRKYSFTKGLTGGDWVGLKYFNKYFSSPMFWPTIRNTFLIAFTSILFGFPAPILLAIVINQVRNSKMKNILQTTVYMPHFISTVVMVSLLVIMLSPSSGLISNTMESMGLITSENNLLGDNGSFVPVYVISNIWQNCGWDSIIYIAALSSIDTQLYDACKIDGANKWQTIWHIEFPALIPTIAILLILNMGNILNVGFEKVFLMQNDLNLSVSEVISTYVYRIGLKSNQFSLGSAIGLFNTIINFFFLMLTNLISKKFADISIF
jgi:putative aldouronate transport system permease protein